MDCSTDDVDFESMKRNMVTVNGEKFVDFQTITVTQEEHLRHLSNMTLRDDDVILVGFPKTGTHWLWEVVHMLTSGSTHYDPRAKEHLMLEAVDTSYIDASCSPRVLNSHLFLRHMSKEIVTKRVRVLHVLRNPKDIAVSLYFHVRQRVTYKDEGFLPFAGFFLQGCEGPGSCTDYFAYLSEMERWKTEHPEVPFCNIYFEDMKEDPVHCVKELARFLGVSASDSLCESIAQACFFQRLKKADRHKDNVLKHLFKGNGPQMYRKGEVGDWKNHFTVAMSERFDDAVAERLKDCSFLPGLRYTL